MPRSFSHWMPRYATRPLRLLIHERLDDPWLTAVAVRFLDDNQNRQILGFRMRSGPSTIVTANRIHIW
jgi:hypothetical protein